MFRNLFYMGVLGSILILSLLVVSVVLTVVFHLCGKNRQVNVSKWIAFLALHITVSPLAFHLSGKWGMIQSKCARAIVLILSPLSVLLILAVIECGSYLHTRTHYPYAQREIIESITGMELPPYEMTCLKMSHPDFHGDIKDCFTLELKVIPDYDFYSKMDSLCKIESDTSYLADDENHEICRRTYEWNTEYECYSINANWEQCTFNLRHKMGSNMMECTFIQM